MTKRLFICGFLLLLIPHAGHAAVDTRLYSFENGTVGNSTTAVDDSIANTTIPGSGDAAGLLWLEVPGNSVRPLPAGPLMNVVNQTALVTPALEALFGQAAYVDVSDGSGLDSPAVGSNVALQFDGTSVFDDVGTAPGSRGVFVDAAAFNANDPMTANENTFESFSILSQAWVRPSSASSGVEQTIYQIGDEQGGVAITADGFWKVNNLGVGWYPPPTGELTSTVPVAFDEWTHVAIFGGGLGGTLYINGRDVAGDLPGDQFFNTFAGYISLGADGLFQTPFAGVVDNFTISGLADQEFDPFTDLDYFDTVETIFEVNQLTGDVTLSNGNPDAVVFSAYSISSANGALDPDNWTSISGNYDAAGDGSLDLTDNWAIVEQSRTNLAEAESPLNDGATLAAAGSVDLGQAWFRSPIRDLAIDLTAPDGSVVDAKVVYVDDNGDPVDPIIVGDLTFEGDINLADWQVFIQNYGADFPGTSAAQSYGFGDLDFDGDSDIDDLQIFRIAFDNVNGEGAFARMVPEPSSMLALLCGALFLRSRRRATASSRGMGWRNRLPLAQRIRCK